MRVSSSNTQATQPNRHINGFKGLKFVTLSSYSHSLLSISRSLLPFADPTCRRFCLSIVNLCISSSTFALRLQRPSSSSPPSLRFNLSISSLRFVYLWICGSVLWVCRSSLWVIDLLILFFRNQTSVDLCILVEIKANRRPIQLDQWLFTVGSGFEISPPDLIESVAGGHKLDLDRLVDRPTPN